jgi:hypothetical protein
METTSLDISRKVKKVLMKQCANYSNNSHKFAEFHTINERTVDKKRQWHGHGVFPATNIK